MLDLEFRHELRGALQFARGTSHYRYTATAATNILDIFFMEKDERIPAVFLSREIPNTNYYGRRNSEFVNPHPDRWLTYENTLCFRRVFNIDRVIEVFNSCPRPQLVKFNNGFYLVGKWFLAKWNGAEIDPLLLIIGTVRKNTPTLASAEFYLSRDLFQPGFKSMKKLVDLLLGEAPAIHIVSEVAPFAGSRIVIPEHRTLKQRKEYVDSLIKYCIAEEIKRTPEPKRKIETVNLSELKGVWSIGNPSSTSVHLPMDPYLNLVQIAQHLGTPEPTPVVIPIPQTATEIAAQIEQLRRAADGMNLDW